MYEYYGKEYLRKEDEAIVDEIEVLREEILNNDSIEEFVESIVRTGGETHKALVRELLSPFSEFLKERIDFYICDLIIAKIDDYPSEEFEKLKEEADERKRLRKAGASE